MQGGNVGKTPASIFGKATTARKFGKLTKNALLNSKRLKFTYNDRKDKNFIAQPKINRVLKALQIASLFWASVNSP